MNLDIFQKHTKIQQTFTNLKQLSFKSETKLQTIKQLIDDTNTQLVHTQYRIDSHIEQGSQHITLHTDKQLKHVFDIATEKMK